MSISSSDEGSCRTSHTVASRVNMSSSLKQMAAAVERNQINCEEETKASVQLAIISEKRKREYELSKREEGAMNQSLHIQSKILDVTKLMEKPDIDPFVKLSYMATVERFTKKQKMLQTNLLSLFP